MSSSDLKRPDLCSIRALYEQGRFAVTTSGKLSANGYLLAEDAPFGPLTREADLGEYLVARHRGQRTEAGR